MNIFPIYSTNSDNEDLIQVHCGTSANERVPNQLPSSSHSMSSPRPPRLRHSHVLSGRRGRLPSELLCSCHWSSCLPQGWHLCNVCLNDGILCPYLGSCNRRNLHDLPEHPDQPGQHVAKLIHPLVRGLPHLEGMHPRP